MYAYLQSNVSADGAAQCYLRDPRTPPVQCGNYSTSQSDYVLTHFAPHTSKSSLCVNIELVMLFNKNMCVFTQMGCTFLLSAMLYLNCQVFMAVSPNIHILLVSPIYS